MRHEGRAWNTTNMLLAHIRFSSSFEWKLLKTLSVFDIFEFYDFYTQTVSGYVCVFAIGHIVLVCLCVCVLQFVHACALVRVCVSVRPFVLPFWPANLNVSNKIYHFYDRTQSLNALQKRQKFIETNQSKLTCEIQTCRHTHTHTQPYTKHI